MRDGALFRMWWSTATAGTISYVEAASADGPWRAPGSTTGGTVQEVLRPGSPPAFDENSVSAPSVVRVGGTYYMYYTGAGPNGARLGVASSTDGRVFARMNGGNPLFDVAPGARTDPQPQLEGAGATFVDGKFVVLFHDSTAPGTAADPSANYPGLYLFRSADPTLQSGVEEWTPAGWAAGTARAHALVAAGGGDLAYVPELARFVVSQDQNLWFFDPSRTSGALTPGEFPSYVGQGGGLVRLPDGSLTLAADCATLPIDQLRELGQTDGGNETDLGHVGVDFLVR
jgi:hypothetical protein